MVAQPAAMPCTDPLVKMLYGQSHGYAECGAPSGSTRCESPARHSVGCRSSMMSPWLFWTVMSKNRLSPEKLSINPAGSWVTVDPRCNSVVIGLS